MLMVLSDPRSLEVMGWMVMGHAIMRSNRDRRLIDCIAPAKRSQAPG
jgi:hypothetical protein